MLTRTQIAAGFAKTLTVRIPGRNVRHYYGCGAVARRKDDLLVCGTEDTRPCRRCMKDAQTATPAAPAPTTCAGSSKPGPKFTAYYTDLSKGIRGACPMYDTCPECGKEGKVISGGAIRAHKPPKK